MKKEEIVVFDEDKIIQAIKELAERHDLTRLGYKMVDVDLKVSRNDVRAEVIFKCLKNLIDETPEEIDPVDEALKKRDPMIINMELE